VNGKQIAAKVKKLGACAKSLAWLRENGDKPFGWLWAACPHGGWMDWLASMVLDHDDPNDKLMARIWATSSTSRSGADEIRRRAGWGASLAVLRALEAL